MKIVVNTQELAPEDKAELMEEHQKVGYFVFSSTESIKEEDIPDEPVEFEGQKTLSQQLYNVLYRLHEAQGGKPEDYPSYRQKVMTKLINSYKSKIDDFKN